MATIKLTVNRQAHTLECASTTLLVEALREHLRLTGTHVGCDTSQCGACTVHVNGKSVKSCTMLAVEANGAEVTTIEGMATGGELHPMIMSATDLCKRNADPSEHDVRHWLEGNLCRCTGYHNIVRSVRAGAAAMRGGKS